MKISRNVLSANGQTSKEDKVVSVDVRPGWKAGTKVTFAKEGDQIPGKIPSDIVFVINEKPHPKFSREGNNLRHKVNISLQTALCGGEVDIPRIDGSSVRHPLKRVINPGTEEVFHGQGMPISKQPGKRGDLLVNYNIRFPETISQQNKTELSKILRRC
jgi:DnaJ-class molecular chaperone